MTDRRDELQIAFGDCLSLPRLPAQHRVAVIADLTAIQASQFSRT